MAKSNKPIWRSKKIVISVPYCPKCGAEMEEEKNADCRTMWHHKCKDIKCNHRY